MLNGDELIVSSPAEFDKRAEGRAGPRKNEKVPAGDRGLRVSIVL
jgi:hypothetical protein